MSEEIKSHHLRALAEEIKPRTLRALACDIEDCHEPQSWADYCRAAAAMLEIKDARIAELEATLATAARVLHKAGEQFTFYANQHATKGTADGDQKAATNQQWAQRCFNAHDAALGGKYE